ncbi:hypothetical protein IWQ60_002367 [Tieghemiomyces parasiticus]|uniref:Late endosomal/lysosomal adaptor and MAPK and MTOR activator 5 n=1 Tax=Tieghemiomyces parasiticus TaxID=78921 RepID=A0A9W8ACV7_9FUNG|nr:hypothetical protein IWQ60_002367 [Tieghemiomyces parasiticus]
MDEPLERLVESLMEEPDVTGVLVTDASGLALAAQGSLRGSDVAAGLVDVLPAYTDVFPSGANNTATAIANHSGANSANNSSSHLNAVANSTTSALGTGTGKGVASPPPSNKMATSAMASGTPATAASLELATPIIQITTTDQILLIQQQDSITVCIAKRRVSARTSKSDPSTPVVELPRFK